MNGVNSNISQYLKSEYGVNQAEVLNNMLETKGENSDALSALKNLVTGDKVTATILDIVGNEVTIGVNNSTVKAALTNSMPVNIGEIVTFEINNDNKSQIVLKPLQSENKANFELSGKALTAANMAVNEKNTSLVMDLLKNNMSVSKESLAEYSKLMANFPSAEPDTFVQLKKLDIPITQENIVQFENYKNYEHSISSKIPDILSGMEQLLEDSESVDVLKQVLDSFEGLSNVKAQDILSKESIDLIKGQLSDKSITPEKLNEMTAKELIDAITKDDSFDKIKNTSEFKNILKDAVRNEMLIEPKEVAKENEIKDFYSKILRETQQIQNILSENGKAASSLASQMSDINDNVNFMNNLNHMMSYVQIPLKFTNQDVHSDLYVFRNKNHHSEGDDVSALLHLDMDNLGKMDVYVKLSNGNNVATNFCMESEEMLDFIESHMDILSNRLNELGYKLNVTTKVTGTDHDFVKDFIDEGKISKEMLKYSFDIKA